MATRMGAIVLSLAVVMTTMAGCALDGHSGPAAATTQPPGNALDRQWARSHATVVIVMYESIEALVAAAYGCSSDSGSTCVEATTAPCQTLQAGVSAAQAVPPVPDPVGQGDWSMALSHYAQGAQDCTAAISGSNPALVEQSVQELTSSKMELRSLELLAGIVPAPA